MTAEMDTKLKQVMRDAGRTHANRADEEANSHGSSELDNILASIGLEGDNRDGVAENGEARPDEDGLVAADSPAVVPVDAVDEDETVSASLHGEIDAILSAADRAINSLEAESKRERETTEKSIAAAKVAAEAKAQELVRAVEERAAELRTSAAEEAKRIVDAAEQQIAEWTSAVQSEARRIMEGAQQEGAHRLANVATEYAVRIAYGRHNLEELKTTARRLAESLKREPPPASTNGEPEQ